MELRGPKKFTVSKGYNSVVLINALFPNEEEEKSFGEDELEYL